MEMDSQNRPWLTLGTIRTLLKWGVHPSDIPGAECIAEERSGSDEDNIDEGRTGVYHIGGFVVKDFVPAVRSKWEDGMERFGFSHETANAVPRAEFAELGIRAARQVVVNGWVIQPYYGEAVRDDWDAFQHYMGTPAYDVYNNSEGRFDLHGGNIALDRRGRYVAFDW